MHEDTFHEKTTPLILLAEMLNESLFDVVFEC